MLTILAGSRRVSALIGVIAVASSTLSATGLEACGTTERASSTPPTAAPTADCASYEPAEAHKRLVARLGDTPFPVMLSDEDAKRHNELYGAASALASDELVLHGTNEPGPPNDGVRSKLQEAIRLYKEALELDPSNFSTMWLIGKVYQRLGDASAAYDWLARAYDAESTQQDGAREASIAALDLGKNEAGVCFAMAAVRSDPTDPGLRANLALAYLVFGDPAQAADVAAAALEAAPSDQVTRTILRLAREVQRGTRKQPHSVSDLMNGP